MATISTFGSSVLLWDGIFCLCSIYAFLVAFVANDAHIVIREAVCAFLAGVKSVASSFSYEMVSLVAIRA
jgi:outer membrane lipoprotein-sorting protein